ncbi:MAG: hypothetical protein EA428_16155 [Spirochaetaceae bacterium]|nr:MAG: hypothetical protein EA428_16155 [Spirochaetaceae bacterium]
MAHRLWIPALLVLLLVLSGCMAPPPTSRVQSSSGADIASAQSESYHGPKAAIAVASFEDKTVGRGRYRREYGHGMQDMLMTSLFDTNRFIVLEREHLGSVMAEQDRGASSRFRQDTAAPIGELEGAQLMVVAAVTEFDPDVGGTGAAVGSQGATGLLGSTALRGVTGATQRAHVGIDMRIVDTATGRIVSATNVVGTARSYDLGVSVLTPHTSGALSTYAGTPMEQAIRNAIGGAVDFVVSQTPAEYYAHR